MLVDPVVGEKFFGRGDVLATLEKRISALKGGYRQNIALTGHRLTGKSSILNHFLHSFKDCDILPIYLEVLPEPFKQFAVKFIGTFLYNYLKYNKRQAKDNLDFLIEECKKDIPQTVTDIKGIMKLLNANEFEEAYSELLNITSTFKKESKKSCIVILDEFHNLSRLGIRDPFKGFGKKIMTQKDTMYIVASSEVSAIKSILSEKLALLFGNFEKITIGGFDKETSEAFLRKKFMSLNISDDLLEFIILFAEGHPFYLDVLSNKIKASVDEMRETEITTIAVIQALEELLFDSRGTLNQFFTNLLQDLIDSKAENCKDTLIAVAHGLNKQSDIAKWTGTSSKDISSHLKILTEKNLIYKNGNVYRFYDNVLRFWLKRVYHKRRTTLIDNISDRARSFRADVAQIIEQSAKDFSLDVPERIKALLESFNNDIVEINSKRRRLVNFDKTEIMEMSGEKYILGHIGKRVCLFYLPRYKIDEYGVMEFMTYSLRYKPQLQRRIILPLFGMDINATLMAKEMKMWLWDLETVNELLDVYGKTKIINVGKTKDLSKDENRSTV
ncbi:MAG: ATP-binding protein [Candidatus Omnitrophica bacterium]|nr:ATP-binding protein [Candidatus Omnitrophota bacterium]